LLFMGKVGGKRVKKGGVEGEARNNHGHPFILTRRRGGKYKQKKKGKKKKKRKKETLFNNPDVFARRAYLSFGVQPKTLKRRGQKEKRKGKKKGKVK